MEKVFEIVKIKQELVEKEGERFIIRSPQDAVDCLTEEIGDEDREVLMVMMLNTKNEVIALHRCHVGALDHSVVSSREIFKGAILNNSLNIITLNITNIIISHNHPSSNPEASPQDDDVTRKISKAGEVLGITLLDHIIVTHSNKDFYSYKEHKPYLLK